MTTIYSVKGVLEHTRSYVIETTSNTNVLTAVVQQGHALVKTCNSTVEALLAEYETIGGEHTDHALMVEAMMQLHTAHLALRDAMEHLRGASIAGYGASGLCGKLSTLTDSALLRLG